MVESGILARKNNSAISLSKNLKHPTDERPNTSTSVGGPRPEEDDVARKRRYWEKWGAEAAKELLSKVELQQHSERQLLYSGKCGDAPRITRSDSEESIATGLSLLTCSEIVVPEPEVLLQRKRRKKKQAKDIVEETVVEQKPNWEQFAKRRTGMLDKLMAKDEAMLEGYITNGAPGRMKVADIMTEEERALLMSCAFRSGIGRIKAESTANISSCLKPIKSARAQSRLQSRISMARTNSSRARSSKMSKKSATLDNRLMSPKVLARTAKLNERRPITAEAAVDLTRQDGRLTSGAYLSPDSAQFFRGSSPSNSQGDASRLAKRHLAAIPDLDGAFLKEVKHRVQSTMNALGRVTGFGDHTDDCTVVDSERGLYTQADYARIPRYPQHIRIAPQLSRVILGDVRARMGRPRSRPIRRKDVKHFDSEQPPLGRFHRNLLVFHWLNNVDSDYDVKKVPDIYDLEGDERPPTRYFPMMTHETCDAYTMESAHLDTSSMFDSYFDEDFISGDESEETDTHHFPDDENPYE